MKWIQFVLVSVCPYLMAVTEIGAANPKVPTTKPSIKPAKGELADFCDESKSVTSAHVITIDGEVIRYTAKIGKQKVIAADDKTEGCIAYISYTQDGADLQKRPVMFAFNGGPGSSSVWLHLGALGPKRLDLGPAGLKVNGKPQLVVNEQSILNLTDLVLIDPISTGYSKAATKPDNAKFFGVQNDVQSIAHFISDYVTQNNRWMSDRFILGESYGGIRAPLVTAVLQDEGMYFSGMILVSPYMSSNSLWTGEYAPFQNFLPTYATTAWYHKKLPPDLQALSIQEIAYRAREFANGDFLKGLSQWGVMTPTEQAAIAEATARFTGLSADIEQANELKVGDDGFFVSLLFGPNPLLIGRYDSRHTTRPVTIPLDGATIDASDSDVKGQFTAGLNYYLRNDLNYETKDKYVISSNAIKSWPYNSDNQGFNVMNQINEVMVANKDLKILAPVGYYDLAVPFAATEWNFKQIHSDLQNRITIAYYEGGHMFYTNPTELKKFKAAMTIFIRGETSDQSKGQAPLTASLRKR